MRNQSITKKCIKTAANVIRNYFDEKYPFYASLKVTGRCQFSCDFCNIWKNPSLDLNTNDVIKILRNLGRSSVVLTSLEGGEPLLRRDIRTILQEACEHPFYVMLTTSQKKLLSYPWDIYQDYIDFLQISIDEGHKNLMVFDVLKEVNQYNMNVCVQTVVRTQDVLKMEEKTEYCAAAGCKILFMPAVTLSNNKNQFPELEKFKEELNLVRKRIPNVIVTSDTYFDRLKKDKGGCSPNSIVIDYDGSIYYPCRPLEKKTVKLQNIDLMKYLNSSGAVHARKIMQSCGKNCGWYQYFATAGLASTSGILEAVQYLINSSKKAA